MVNPVQSITEYNGDDFENYLETLRLIDIFEELILAYKHDKGLLKQITKYIVYAYSLNSEQVIIGMEWGDNKKKIFEYVMLPDYMLEDVVELTNPVIVSTIEKWFDSQNNEVYKELVMLKDLKLQMQKSFTLPISEVSYNQKFDNAIHCQKINSMIKELQSELIQNTPKLKNAASEVRTSKRKNTLGAEKFAK